MVKPKPKRAFAFLALIVLVFGAYWPALSADFIYLDDTTHIVANKVVTGGLTWESILAAFKPHASLWTPLTWISHMAVVEFAGLDARWHHLVNVVLQAIAVVLLFSWLLRLTGRFWVSLAVSTLFAVHPLNVENVVWVTERNHLLAIVFLFVGLHTYNRHVAQVARPGSSKASGWMRLTELAMLLSIMSKGVFLTFPALLLILDFWPYRRLRGETLRALLLEKSGLFAVALFSMFMTMRSLSPETSSGETLSLTGRVCIALTTLGWQAFRVAVPVQLSPIHPMPQETLWVEATVSAAAIILAGLIAWRARKQMPWLLAGIAWYLVCLAPVSGITQAGNTFFSDRFVYLPQIGLFFAGALTAADLLSRARRGIAIGVAGLAALVVAYGGITFWYARFWKDTATLFTYAAGATENNFIAHTTAALALMKKNDTRGALPHYEAGLRINPEATNYRIAYGDALMELDRSAEAAAQFEGVLAREPAHPAARFRLAIAQLRLGRAAEALANFKTLKERQVNAPDLDKWIESAAAQAAREKSPDAR